ncbi:MAG: hypothetical protein IJK13_00190 [Lachnospiraceae bacterium]|nr:hypothetical protein [Lachnospiraceae bacterium]
MKNLIETIIKCTENKKVFIWGYGTLGGMAHFTLRRIGRNIEGIIDSDPGKQGMTVGGATIISLYDLLYYDKNDIMILVCSDRGKAEIVKELESMGFSSENYTTAFLDERCEKLTMLNPQLGWCRGEGQLHLSDGANGDDTKILVLGGSTTDYSLNGITSWPQFLQNRINKEGKNYAVINGAVSGYTSGQELLSVITYGISLRPKYLITYSGYNDAAGVLKYEYNDWHATHTYDELIDIATRTGNNDSLAMYYGNEVKESAELWLRNARMIHAICEEWQIKHIHILQPTILITGSMDDNERDICENGPYKEIYKNVNGFYKTIKEELKHYDWIADFTDIFADDDVYYDTCHVNEEGNRIISDKVYDLIESNLSED